MSTIPINPEALSILGDTVKGLYAAGLLPAAAVSAPMEISFGASYTEYDWSPSLQAFIPS